VGRRARPEESPSETLSFAALKAVLGPGAWRAIKRNAQLLIIIETPTRSWVDPIVTQAGTLFPAARVVGHSKPARPVDQPQRVIVDGAVLAITGNLDWLDRSVLGAADLSLSLKIRPSIVECALRRFSGRTARVAHRDIAGLDFHDFVVAMRPGSSAQQCVKRFARASATRTTVSDHDATPRLEMLVGYGATLVEVRRIADEIERYRRGRSSEAKLPSILLHGRPGSGKTMLAKSLAKSVGLPIVMTSVGGWFAAGQSAHLGTVIAAACAFFDTAVAAAPCIAFVDELDAVPDRATMDDRGRDWWTPVITTLLTEIDRIRLREGGVVLVAATNYFDRLDEALKRPGRFDRHLEIVGPKTLDEILAVLRFHLGPDLAAADLSPFGRVALANEATGAALEGWARAARELARSRNRPMRLDDLVAAAFPLSGQSGDALRGTAIHEAGHAVVGRLLGLDVESVSIVKEAGSIGRTTIDRTAQTSFTASDIEVRAIVGLAGRAADEVLTGQADAGSISDLFNVTRLIAASHAAFGFGATLVTRASLDDVMRLVAADPMLAIAVDDDMQRYLERARNLVRRHEAAIRALAEELVSKLVLGPADVDAAIDAYGGPHDGAGRPTIGGEP
jgi:cell division protease FtsH